MMKTSDSVEPEVFPWMGRKLEFIEQLDRTVGGGAHDAPSPFMEQNVP